jgi:pimeloyl-ACP methyl ester carboxylesterase
MVSLRGGRLRRPRRRDALRYLKTGAGQTALILSHTVRTQLDHFQLIGSARLPAIGPLVTKLENTPVLGVVLRGGLFDGSKLPNHYLAELRRAGRRRGYARVAKEVFRNVDSMIAARALYARVSAPVSLVYGDHDWSRPRERDATLELLRNARSISLPDTGHFAALEQPARIAEVLLERRLGGGGHLGRPAQQGVAERRPHVDHMEPDTRPADQTAPLEHGEMIGDVPR